MSFARPARSADTWFRAETERRFAAHCQRAQRRARTSGRSVLASVTVHLHGSHDPSAIVFASRRPGEPFQCIEQPGRSGSAVAALGSVLEFTAEGSARFNELAKHWRRVLDTACFDPRSGAPGAGLTAFAGFAFAPQGAADPNWDDFGSASLVVPRISLARSAGSTWLTVNACVAADDTPELVVARVSEQIAELRERELPLLDPSPTGTYRVYSVMPPAHHEEIVARAVDRIRAGELEKVVLAREVRVAAPRPHDAAAVFGALRDGFVDCFTYAVGRGGATFLGATPELLVRREGNRASTVALAGSTRRSADPAVDDHLGEQLLRNPKERHENAIVARRIASTLSPLSVWVTVGSEPVLVRVANIQHLAAPVRAQLAEPVSVIELAGLLHPTPAVGGEPADIAARLIPSLEGFDRGWYAGTLGWIDAQEDGEFSVSLRCALLRGEVASCYAGGGIVADSDPSAELAETEIKLQALLPVLAG